MVRFLRRGERLAFPFAASKIPLASYGQMPRDCVAFATRSIATM